jgi:mxaK protein
MGLISRRTTRAAWWLLAVVAIAAAADGALWQRDQRRNAQITSGTVPADATGLPAPLLFAQAHVLAANGDDDAALTRYGTLQGDTPLGQAARYNSANVLMRQAVALRAQDKPGQALALIELAKEHYRDVLRHDPGHWHARYNLERAQRLVPDPEESDAPVAGPQRSAERAATTMRGFSPGLP